MDDDLYFVDTRNADPRDHRVVRPGAIVPARAVPVTSVAAVPRVTYATPTYGAPPAMSYPPTFFGASPGYSQGPIYGQPGQLGSLFGGLNLGDVLKIVADGFAAFKGLPTAPTPTGDVATDVANMDVHMSALAKDAQTRKQIELAGEIAGRFGRGYWNW